MQKILRRRILRDLRENFSRYLALLLLIILCMFLVISIVGAAETVIGRTEEFAEKNKLEDGEFFVFVPLNEKEEQWLEKKGVKLERHFYLDYEQEDESTLRVFADREKLDLVELDEGKKAASAGEIVLEKRYCEEHKIHVGDRITIGGMGYTVSGIGTAADYEAPYRNLGDSAVDSFQFGVAFVTQAAYQDMSGAGKSIKAEEYMYAYRLDGDMTEKKLKEHLKDIKVDPEDIEDEYFTQYWEETAGEFDDFEEGMDDFKDGTGKLKKGLGKLKDANRSLNKGADAIFEAMLSQASESLKELGEKKELTKKNYQEILQKRIDASDGMEKFLLKDALDQLDSLKEYKDGIKDYTDGEEKAYKGAKKLKDGVDDFYDDAKKAVDEMGFSLSNLTQLVSAEDNLRILASADDQQINLSGGLVAGMIIIILFAYVISVFVIHGIEKEISIIGTLYALGIKKRELIMHYLTLPVAVTLIGGLVGTLLGYSSFGVGWQMEDNYAYFSTPVLPVILKPYLLVYGIVMPPVLAAIVNYLVISGKLSAPALHMMRNEQKRQKIHQLDLKNMGFISRFRIRQMLREMRTALTVFFGMLISLVVVMIGLNCYSLCENLRVENKADTKFSYMYTYKYPEKEVPEGGYEAYAQTFQREHFGYQFDVTVLGITKDNPFFDAEPTDSKSNVIVSSALAQKFGVGPGDEFVVKDDAGGLHYAFAVEDSIQYSSGFYIFMDIDSMRDMFGADEDYYNVVFADHDLKVDTGRLYSTLTDQEISKSAEVFTGLMMSMIVVMVVVSCIIYAVVMYLMMKVMIDRSAYHIALMKIFGYRTGDIRKLYLNGNFYVVLVSSIICVPASKLIMNGIYPYFISNVPCAMDLKFPVWMYAAIYAMIIGLYFLTNAMLVGRLKKMLPAEVLKNRE